MQLTVVDICGSLLTKVPHVSTYLVHFFVLKISTHSSAESILRGWQFLVKFGCFVNFQRKRFETFSQFSVCQNFREKLFCFRVYHFVGQLNIAFRQSNDELWLAEPTSVENLNMLAESTSCFQSDNPECTHPYWPT